MTRLYIDIETYCQLDLRKSNVYRYTNEPSFQVRIAAWAVDDGPVEVAESWSELLQTQVSDMLLDPSVVKIAHNAAFERVALGAAMGGGPLPVDEWHDTMAVASVRGYPAGLAALAIALGVEEKDAAGTLLINKWCKPDRKTGAMRQAPDDPASWDAFVRYCAQDVATLREVDRVLGDFPTETERAVYFTDQRINDRGLRVDTDLATAAKAAAELNHVAAEAELSALTGLAKPGHAPSLAAWLRARGLEAPDVRAETVLALLSETAGEDSPRRRALELREQLAMTASKKFSSALDGVCPDGRLRGAFRYFGAHTGRWSGRGAQPQNLPRAAFSAQVDVDLAVSEVLAGDPMDPLDLKRLVRPMFLVDGAVVDYSAIEARVLAWLAGEKWALRAFEEGRDIYTETAGRMGRGMGRQEGKVAVLALGYGGSVGALRAMGYGADLSDDALRALSTQWRRANPRIVRFWGELEEAFRHGGRVGAHVRVRARGSSRAIMLPSSRGLVYRGVKLGDRVTFASPRGFRADTYGGRLTENVVQAVARDLLAEALVRLDAAGVPVVGHVHDEVITETDDLERVRSIMLDSPAWAAGLPMGAEGFVCGRYRKG